MRFKVTWNKAARRKLATLYLAATDKKRFSAAANRIDALLERDPLKVGAVRSGNRRLLHEDPLLVAYDVFLDDRRVEVIDLKSYSPEM